MTRTIENKYTPLHSRHYWSEDEDAHITTIFRSPFIIYWSYEIMGSKSFLRKDSSILFALKVHLFLFPVVVDTRFPHGKIAHSFSVLHTSVGSVLRRLFHLSNVKCSFCPSFIAPSIWWGRTQKARAKGNEEINFEITEIN